jgi:hypothetical protein
MGNTLQNSEKNPENTGKNSEKQNIQNIQNIRRNNRLKFEADKLKYIESIKEEKNTQRKEIDIILHDYLFEEGIKTIKDNTNINDVNDLNSEILEDYISNGIDKFLNKKTQTAQKAQKAQTEKVCVICLEEVKIEITLVPCGHCLFHKDCINKLFTSSKNNNCPICRKQSSIVNNYY